MYGKIIRLSRLMHYESQRICILPIDHGTTMGPIKGIEDYNNIISQGIIGGADAIILHKGLLNKICSNPELAAKGRYIMHLSASTMYNPDPSDKVLVGTVEEAIKLGADGISVHINLGTNNESDMIKDLGYISKSCMEWGMPLLAMMYNQKKPSNSGQIIHAARLAEELGADIVKVEFPGMPEEVEKMVNCVKIPVLIAGGAATNEPEKLLRIINDALLAGAAGVAIGRNIFQHEFPQLITSVIAQMVHREIGLEEGLFKLRNKFCMTPSEYIQTT